MATTNLIKPPPKPKNLKFVRAKFAYLAKESDELTFNEGDLLVVLDSTSDPAWWRAKCRGLEGFVPSNFLTSKTASEDMEANPFHDACKRGNVALLEECLLNQVPVNVPDLAGNSGLHWAARGGHEDVMERLVSLGPQLDVNLENRLGDGPIHLAARKGNKRCIELLRSTGRIDVRKPNKDGLTPYDLATDLDAKEALKLWMKESCNQDEDIEYEKSEDEEDKP